MRKIANLKENIMEILKNKREKLRLNGIVIDVVKDNEEEYYIILEKEKYWASIVMLTRIVHHIKMFHLKYIE